MRRMMHRVVAWIAGPRAETVVLEHWESAEGALPRGIHIPRGPDPKPDPRVASRLQGQAEQDGRADAGAGLYDGWPLPEFDDARNRWVSGGRLVPALDKLAFQIAIEKHALEIRESEERRLVTKLRAEAEADLKINKQWVERAGKRHKEAAAEEQAIAEKVSASATRSPIRRGFSFGRLVAWVILLGFMVTEALIQYAIFDYFGDDPATTMTFVIGASLILIAAPHLAGTWQRRCRETEDRADRPLLVYSWLAMACWLVAVAIAAYLRYAIAVAEKADPRTESVYDPLKNLNIEDPRVIALYFLGLMLISGLLTIALSYAQSGQKRATLRASQAQLKRCRRDYEAAQRELEVNLRVADDRKREEQELVRRWTEHKSSYDDLYNTCAQIYLQAAAQVQAKRSGHGPNGPNGSPNGPNGTARGPSFAGLGGTASV